MENNIQNQNVVDDRIAKTPTKKPIEVTRVYKSDWQKEGTMSAEMKQTIETISSYPTKSVRNEAQDNIFANEDFGFAAQNYTSSETRVAWIDVPENSTVEIVKAQIAKFPGATIYKVLSNKPILTSDQKYAVNVSKVTTVDVIASRQAVRYPETHDDATLRGKLILDQNGKIQFRVSYFSNKEREDVDMRTTDPADFYVPEDLKAELLVAAGQSTM